MIRRYLRDHRIQTSFDVCIIGSGAMALCLLEELAGRDLEIICIVGGDLTNTPHWQKYTDCELHGTHHGGARSARPRVAGGATTLWGGQALPFQQIDFEKRSWVQMSGWPISFTEVAKYYARARRFLGLPSSFPKDQVEAIQKEVAALLSPKLEVLASEWSPRPNLFRVKRSQLERQQRLTVLRNCHAVKLLPTQNDSPAIQISDGAGSRAVISATVVIIAAGAIENARVLLETERSAAGAISLSHLLGRCFQDHVACNYGVLFPKHPKYMSRALGKRYLRGNKLMPKLHVPEKFQREHCVMNGACHLVPIDGNLGALQQLLVQKKWRMLLCNFSNLARYFAARVVQKREVWWSKAFTIELQVEQEPDVLSRVSLSDDYLDQETHKPVLNWHVSPLTFDTLKAAGDFFVRIFREDGIGDCNRTLDASPVLPIRDVYHMMGTTRMGLNAREGVVDSNCELFNLPNVYVAGASVFPTGSFSNPTLTALALAIRLADRLKARFSPNQKSLAVKSDLAERA
jgi:choline dehydrogenase-like flavoprotein